MSLRRFLLRVMLWCLGLAAGFGVLAVLLSWDETAWRVIGTMAVSAAAAGLLMVASLLSERKRFAAAGMLGMGIVLVEWCLAVVLIWELPAIFSASRWRWNERLGLTMVVGIVGIWTVLGLVASAFAISRVAGYFTSIISAVCAALWLSAVWDWPIGGHWELFGTGWVFAAFGGLATLSLLDYSPRRVWAWAGIAAAALGAFLACGAIWGDWEGGGGGLEVIVSVALLSGYWSIIRLVKVGRPAAWLKKTLLVLAWITAVATDLAILADYQHIDPDLLYRLASSAGILTGCGTLALLVLARLARKEIPAGEMPEIKAITLVCPVCGKRVSGELAKCTCANCGMGFKVELKEPRCAACNYLLLMLKSDRCPECGAPVQSA